MMFFYGFRSGNTLYVPGAILEDDKDCFPEDAHAAHPAAEDNFLLHKSRKGFDKYALIDRGHPAKTSCKGEFCWSQEMRRCHPASGSTPALNSRCVVAS